MTTTATERSAGGTIQLVGEIWQPGVGVCAMTYTIHPFQVENMRTDGSISREDVQDFLDRNAGDFQHITDFRAVIDDGPLPACGECGQVQRRVLEFDWADEENEIAFNDAMFGTEE